jgi:CRISPR/Cas system-associated exonuclease Cas4 (RecB family)
MKHIKKFNSFEINEVLDVLGTTFNIENVYVWLLEQLEDFESTSVYSFNENLERLINLICKKFKKEDVDFEISDESYSEDDGYGEYITKGEIIFKNNKTNKEFIIADFSSLDGGYDPSISLDKDKLKEALKNIFIK